MNEEQLKDWVAKQLNMSVSDYRYEVLWEYLKNKRHVAMALRGEEEPEELVETAIDRLEIARALAKRAPKSDQSEDASVETILSDHERNRTATTAAYLAAQAAKEPEVRRFREEVLLSELPSAEPARELLDSFAAAAFSLAWFKSWGVPVIGHRADVRVENERRIGDVVHRNTVIRVDPPGVTIPLGWRYDVRSGPEGLFRRTLEYLTEGGDTVLVRVTMGSVLDKLRETSEVLASRLGWRAAEAARFVLTDKAPVLHPIITHIDWRDGTIILEAKHWVLARTVEAVYNEAQQRLLNNASNRQVGDSTLAVVRFVLEHTDEEGNHPSWEELRKRWNRAHPEHTFENRSGLFKAYHRGSKSIGPPMPSDV